MTEREEKICFCFNYTDKDIEVDALASGRSTIMERIMAEKKTDACNCSTMNPKGR